MPPGSPGSEGLGTCTRVSAVMHKNGLVYGRSSDRMWLARSAPGVEAKPWPHFVTTFLDILSAVQADVTPKGFGPLQVSLQSVFVATRSSAKR